MSAHSHADHHNFPVKVTNGWSSYGIVANMVDYDIGVSKF